MKHAHVAALVAAGIAIGGCSAGSARTSAPAAVPMSLETLAKQTGCTVQVQTNAAELRQGYCKTGAGRYVLLTFPSDKAAKTWFTEARNWGGIYLIGARWIIVGTTQQLQGFRVQVGGEITPGDDHGGHDH
jgi:hypothetical protein